MYTQLPFFGVVRVLGDDRHSFLHSQLSNDINNLAAEHACYATYNTPKGRVIANMLVQNSGSELYLLMAADLVEAVVKRLRMFVMRAKVQFEVLADWGVAGTLPDDAPVYYADAPQLSFPAPQQRIELPHGGVLQFGERTTLPEHDSAAEQQWARHEIRCGYPWIAAASSESCVAQMLNQHTIGGVHFRKGCYPGQEIIARAQYRGQVKRGLAIAESLLPQSPGSRVNDAEGSEAGIVINSVGGLSLLVIKHAAASGAYDSEGAPFALKHLFFSIEAKDE